VAEGDLPGEPDANTLIRGFEATDATAVRDLFVLVNRLLSPPHLRTAFEAYIARSLSEEIGRIPAYYAEHAGGFWVACRGEDVVGMFGLEAAGPNALELRRMYVAPAVRRAGIATAMLQFAEDEARRRGAGRLELSTSALQPAAIALYQRAGYRLVREVVADHASNKTVGGGIRRYHFEKMLG
jgi:GNAT superfamily N-acetyltransferase